MSTSGRRALRRVLAAATAVLLAVAVPATAGGSPALADVPVAAADTGVVSVKAGGLRTTSGNVDALAGVQLELRTDDQGSPGALVGTCQSDDDGDCSFVVGQTGSGGGNRNKQFWVAQSGAPDGWFANRRRRPSASPVGV